MNNALLTGLVSNSGKTGFLNFQSSDNKDSSLKGQFLSLLQDRLAFNGETTGQDSSFLSRASSTSSKSSISESSFRPVNIWERPVSQVKPLANKKPEATSEKKIDEKDSSAEKSVNPTEDAKSFEETEATQSSKTDDSAKTEAEEKMEKLMTMLEANPEIQKLLSNLNQDDISAIVEAMENMDTGALQAIQENPETLVDKLLTELNKLPDSEDKTKLIEMVGSKDFSELLSNLAGVSLETRSTETTRTTVAPIESETANSLASTRQNKKADKTGPAAVDANAVSNEESGETENVVSDEDDLSEEKVTSKNKEKNLDTKEAKEAKNPHKDEVRVKEDGETLRQTFNRVNKLDSKDPLSMDSEPNAVTNKPQTEQSNQSNFRFQETGIEAKPMVLDEVSRKLISSLLQKGSNVSEKVNSFTYGPITQNGNKSSSFQNNAGGNNGFANGFSSNHGSNSTFATNRQVPTGNNSVFLSQLLEKAEMIKTSDGKKVLSLEMDPKELGKMEMELTSKDGTVTAKISAENDLAKAKLEELAPQIKEHLNNQGINLTEITVDISSGHPDERNKHQMSDEKNKSSRTEGISATGNEQIIRKNILPNLRKVALNIQSVDLTV